jgi:hypothetical protein
VSIHYYVAPDGTITQFVADHDTAWHTGASSWRVDGQERRDADLNHLSIGIELSGLNKPDSVYPDAQYVATVELMTHLRATYQIPLDQVVRHRDIAPHRKTDPANFPWTQLLVALEPTVFMQPAPPVYSVESPLMGTPLGTAEQAIAALTRRSTKYTSADIRLIVDAYVAVGSHVGLDWFLALAQLNHETGGLTSWWAERPRRNAAGIGVTGHTVMGLSSTPPLTGSWAWDGSVWREGVSFAAWTPGEAGNTVASCEAHLGRLLAYSTKPGERWGEQVSLVDRALSVRELPLAYHGCAPTLRGLGGTWAVPGTTYAARLAAIANAWRTC